VLSFKN